MRVLKVTPRVYSKVFNWMQEHEKEAEMEYKYPEPGMKNWCLINNEKVELKICEDGDTDAKYIIDGMDVSLKKIKEDNDSDVSLVTDEGGKNE